VITLKNHLSIRTYTRKRRGHRHDFHQLVLPLTGVIHLEMDQYAYQVLPGECVVITAATVHHFTADEKAQFVVADLMTLPEHLLASEQRVFDVSAPLNAFLGFVQKQLQHQVHGPIEDAMVAVFYQLLCEQSIAKVMDPRIRKVQLIISEHLASPLSVNELAEQACLSATQFKKVFKEATGCTVMQYIAHQRMDRAKALLSHTDYPVSIVAEKVGYLDVSAFSRRFSKHFGVCPRSKKHLVPKFYS
jgi:AraC-like DNA-binding protein